MGFRVGSFFEVLNKVVILLLFLVRAGAIIVCGVCVGSFFCGVVLGVFLVHRPRKFCQRGSNSDNVF